MSSSRLINGVEVASHYRDAEHQYLSNKEGIWLFMVTEILMFGGLFVGYIIFHTIYPEMFAEGASYLDWHLGFINTLVLIGSSLTMALGIYYNQIAQPKKATYALIATVLCGAVFMVIKYFEYTHKFHLGIFPGMMLDAAKMAEHGHPVGLAEHDTRPVRLLRRLLPALLVLPRRGGRAGDLRAHVCRVCRGPAPVHRGHHTWWPGDHRDRDSRRTHRFWGRPGRSNLRCGAVLDLHPPARDPAGSSRLDSLGPLPKASAGRCVRHRSGPLRHQSEHLRCQAGHLRHPGQPRAVAQPRSAGGQHGSARRGVSD